MSHFYKVIEHTADLGVRVWGNSLENLFINAARAVLDILIGPQLEKGRGAVVLKVISIEAVDRGELLVKWLQEILYLFDVKRSVVQEIRIKSETEKKLIAELEVAPFDYRVHEVRREIKAVTYHNLKVEKLPDGTWEAEVIFDI